MKAISRECMGSHDGLATVCFEESELEQAIGVLGFVITALVCARLLTQVPIGFIHPPPAR